MWEYQEINTHHKAQNYCYLCFFSLLRCFFFLNYYICTLRSLKRSMQFREFEIGNGKNHQSTAEFFEYSVSSFEKESYLVESLIYNAAA